MGGLGPGIGGSELIVIGLVALLVVGPKDLPLLMRRVGQFVAKARGMANDFRASFDEMARQSELDDLRKEVEALRRGQGMHPLGDEAAAAFKDINQSLSEPMTSTPAISAPSATPTSEWPDTTAEALAAEVEPAPKPKRKSTPRKTTAKAEPAEPKPTTTGKAAARRASNARAAAETAAAAAKPARTPRKRTPKS